MLIEWNDSIQQTSGWGSFDANAKDSHRIKSVGYVIESNPTFLVVAPNLHIGNDDLPDQMMGSINIPKTSITSITPLVNDTTQANAKDPANVSA